MWWDSVIGPAKNEVFKWLPEAWIILFFLTIFSVLRWLKIFSRPAVPKVTVSRKSEKNKMSKMINQMTILQKPFVTPKLWGRSGHVQTAIYGALKHPSLTRRSAQRILLPLADGSTSSFDLFEPIDQHQSGHDITLVLTPGITNSSESNYIKTCVHHALDHGFRCAALNHIGVLASEQVTGNRIFNYGMIDELEAMMDYLGENYPKMFFITIGFSMGANQTTLYLLRTPKERRPRLLMGMSICQGYSATVSMPMYHDWMQGRRFYNQMIAENVKRLLRRNYATVVAPHVKSGRLDEGKLWASSSIAALDENYNRRVVDRPSLDDFYNWCSCLPHLEKLDLPMIFLNTDDDPVIPAELFEPVQKMCEERDDMAFVRTKHGGHLGFLEGDSFSPSSITWLDKFIVEAANRAISTYAH